MTTRSLSQQANLQRLRFRLSPKKRRELDEAEEDEDDEED